MIVSMKWMRVSAFVAATMVWGLPAMGQETRPVFFAGPSPCSSVSKVEREKVFLSTPERCDKRNPAMINVSVAATLQELQLFNNGTLWKRHRLVTVSPGAADAALGRGVRAQKDLKAKRVSPESNRYIREAGELAARNAETVYSDAFQARINAEQDRLKTEVFGAQLRGTQADPKQSDTQAVGTKVLAEDERIYLFVSSSMPETTVRTYLQSLDKVQDPRAVMLLRGFVGGAKMMKPTTDYLHRMLARDRGCDPRTNGGKACDVFRAEIQIDPLLFKRYNITRVPAVVFARGVKTPLQGSEGDGEVSVGSWWALEGDAALDDMLERINGQAKSPSLGAFVKAIRKGFF